MEAVHRTNTAISTTTSATTVTKNLTMTQVINLDLDIETLAVALHRDISPAIVDLLKRTLFRPDGSPAHVTVESLTSDTEFSEALKESCILTCGRITASARTTFLELNNKIVELEQSNKDLKAQLVAMEDRMQVIDEDDDDEDVS